MVAGTKITHEVYTISIVRDFVATDGTASVLKRNNMEVEVLKKIGEGSPNVLDGLNSGEVKLIITYFFEKNPANHGGRRSNALHLPYYTDCNPKLRLGTRSAPSALVVMPKPLINRYFSIEMMKLNKTQATIQERK